MDRDRIAYEGNSTIPYSGKFLKNHENGKLKLEKIMRMEKEMALLKSIIKMDNYGMNKIIKM